jgi:hypothetical protein
VKASSVGKAGLLISNRDFLESLVPFTFSLGYFYLYYKVLASFASVGWELKVFSNGLLAVEEYF